MSIVWSISPDIKQKHIDTINLILESLSGEAQKRALKEENKIYNNLCEHITNYLNS